MLPGHLHPHGEVSMDRWVYRLPPQQSGRAQQSYAVMNPVEDGNYKKVKAAILRRYEINEETYWKCFRAATKGVLRPIESWP